MSPTRCRVSMIGRKSRPGGACWLLFLALAFSPACRLYQLERKLNPTYADFLSKVQYIMTREERKIFLEMPDSERDGFIEDFWKRRNPNPEAEDNPFKREYYSRIKMADNLFHGEGRPGYLTDRGRIYVLFGPPTDRLTYPMDATGYCREVWYYGGFPVIFTDEYCQGLYVLTAINLEHLEALNIAQGHFQQTIQEDRYLFDYSASVMKVRSEAARFEGKVVLDVPYAGIWFTSDEERLWTSLDVRVEARDALGVKVWEGSRDCALAMTEDELKEKRDKSYRIEIPFVLDKDLEKLRKRRLVFIILVRSTAGGDELQKSFEFLLKS